MKKQDAINKYYFHKKRFNIHDNEYLNLFEKLLKEIYIFDLECSCKIENKNINFTRINIHCDKNIKKNLKLILKFYHNISLLKSNNLNFSILKKIFDDINFRKIKKIVVGIDFRERSLKESKIKFYIQMHKDYDKIKQFLKFHGINSDIEQLLKAYDLSFENEFSFGFDFLFNGLTKSKFYLTFDNSDLNNIEIKNILFNSLSNYYNYFIKSPNKIHISFREKDFQKVIYVHLNNNTQFEIKNNKINKIKKLIEPNYKIKIISFFLLEFNHGNVERFNIYY